MRRAKAAVPIQNEAVVFQVEALTLMAKLRARHPGRSRSPGAAKPSKEPITVTGLGSVTFRKNRFRDTRLRQRLDRHQTLHGQTGGSATSLTEPVAHRLAGDP